MVDNRKDTKKVAVCLIQNPDGKFLMTRPSELKHFGEYQDAWYPPTGHVKEGETITDALIREANEELGLIIKPIKLISEWQQDIPGEIAYWWNCDVVSGEIKMNEEIAEYKYFSPEEIKKLKLWPAEKKFFDKYF